MFQKTLFKEFLKAIYIKIFISALNKINTIKSSKFNRLYIAEGVRFSKGRNALGECDQFVSLLNTFLMADDYKTSGPCNLMLMASSQSDCHLHFKKILYTALIVRAKIERIS